MDGQSAFVLGTSVLALMLLIAGRAWRRRDKRYQRGIDRLREQVRMLAASEQPLEIDVQAQAQDGLKDLADAINELARSRDAARSDVQHQVQEISADVRKERNRLAALMAELAQSVVVCNLDGRILLYNNRARMQFKLLSRGKTANGNMPILGIGRSIYALLDQSLLDHALENIRLRMDRGAAQPATQFLTTTPSGQFLRVHMAPVRETEGEPAETDLQGFVLMLENVTSSFTEEDARDEALVNLTESARTHLASMRVILNSLEQSTDPSGAQLAFLREQLDKAQARIQDVSASTVQTLKTRWPLEEMQVADLLSVAQRRIAKHTGKEVSADVAEPDLWVKVDSFSVLQSLVYLASRLVDEFDMRYLQLRAQGQGDKVLLDLIWTGHNMSTETVMSWELDSMTVGQSQTPLSVRDVMNRHSGMLSFERERVRHQAMFRLTLPAAGAQEQRELDALLPTDSRPEFFDFDLFKSTPVHSVLDDVLLSELSYTVFDTETTGLNPSQGDEIIQIGATRIVNGKLLRHEAYEQLVNPQRNIPAASIPIHGITQDMVRGRPTIGEVLPVFHAYAKDTVLVAHNAAFDMKFLQLKERSTGLRFDQPVLDTLLLSAVLHPNQESHRLDAIAQRMSITVTGRHNALGDAMATAEVFLRMIPLLADMGIHTLGQARQAAQKTFYARLKY
ncbi:MAG: hypothetical protein RLZ63_1172 [Pseudomonadota bacterium]